MSENKVPLRKIILGHLFDFFMLFLAVSLGFLADSYRDDQKSDKLASDLASDLVTDISADTSAINFMLDYCHTKKNTLDTLYFLVDDGVSEFKDSMIYRFSAQVNKRPWFERHGSTIYLLLNAGYLSYFTKDASVAITGYDLECQKLISLLEQERMILNDKIYPFLEQTFHIENFVSILQDGSFVCKPDLNQWTADKRWQYHNHITEMKILNNNILIQYHKLKSKAGHTLNLIAKEYQ